MTEVHIAVGEQGCELANELRAIAIIVDALRASATLTSLFEQGVNEVWVVAEVEEAWRLKTEMADALLVGERNSLKIEGFDFSNSPTEILQAQNLRGQRAIFTSTTGAKRILACQQATVVLIGTTVNASAVANAAKNLAEQVHRPIVVVASGVYGRGEEWALEDIAAGWEIAKKIGCQVTSAPLRPCGNLEQVFSSSPHGQELISLGLQADVNWCAQVNKVSIVPKVFAFQGFAAVLHRYSDSP
ncbi:MAG: 2-phosphosulfolactate phosphatase [Candidatus Fervidibacter sp.]|uniref:2-phosphosulfolactate phosphatase n=1 Tax=Candidatus Fervidibacter sp. TaxID=3100871 RepID=UPI00404B4E55